MNYDWIRNTEKARIVTHRDADGIMSAVLVYSVLKDQISEIVTTDYDEIDANDDDKHKFIFTENDIVVDLPQPDIDVIFWADHHGGSMRHGLPVYPHLYDEEAASCAGLLYRYLVKRFRSLRRFSDLIAATDMIDIAAYPDAKYQKNTDDYGNIIRLGLNAGSFVHDNLFYKPALIRALAETKDWRKVLRNPLHMSRVYASLFRYREYEKEAVKHLFLRGKVVYSDIGGKKLPGLLNRFFAFELFPEAYYSLSVYAVKGLHRMVLSRNPFNNDIPDGQPNLGEIAKAIHPKGGGHEGIGIIPGIKKDKKDETISYLLDLLNA